jgi:GH15 family glucan-1,4-alpha-glucosidase
MHTIGMTGINGSIDWLCFPQAFTHLALISAAYNLDKELG